MFIRRSGGAGLNSLLSASGSVGALEPCSRRLLSKIRISPFAAVLCRSGYGLFWFCVNGVPYLQNFSFPIAAMATVRFLAYFLDRGDPLPLSSAGEKIVLQFLAFSGTVSYSLYLLHAPVFEYLMTFMARADRNHRVPGLQFACVILALGVVTGLSCLLYRFVETPGIAFGKRVVGWLRQQQAGQTQLT